MSEDSLRLSDKLSKTLQEQFGIVADDAAEAIAQLGPLLLDAAEEARAGYDAIYAEYVAQGAIYGASREGMWRWLLDSERLKTAG